MHDVSITFSSLGTLSFAALNASEIMKKQLLGILLSLMMVLGLMPGMSLTALAGEPTDEDLNIDPHVPPEKTQASISYDTKNVIKTYGDEAFTNKLDRTGDATVSYAST